MEKIVLKNAELLQFTYLQNIIYCRGDEHTTNFYLAEGPPLIADKGFAYFEKTLPKSGFISPDKGVLVNITHVTLLHTVWPCYIELSNGERIPMAYFRRKQIMHKIQRLQS
jgi:DNA-binding LytR/AlgR family response regulator